MFHGILNDFVFNVKSSLIDIISLLLALTPLIFPTEILNKNVCKLFGYNIERNESDTRGYNEIKTELEIDYDRANPITKETALK